MGNRSLNTSFTPKLNVAERRRPGRAGAGRRRRLRLPLRPPRREPRSADPGRGGRTRSPASAPARSATARRSPARSACRPPTALFGDSGVHAARDRRAGLRASNVAPVSVRLIPVIEDLSLEATDGTLLRRSRPALFRGLGRRPRGGDRWGQASAGSAATPNPSGGDPYTLFPPDQCLVAGCSTRLVPEYSFTSSDPDIADFVRQDPASTNLRKPFLDAGDKVVTDNTSGLLCPFNAGTTTVTVSAGGYSYSEQVTVLGGSVQRPCGTRPLRPDRFKRASRRRRAARSATAAPAAPAGSPPVEFSPPPPPPPPPPAPPPPSPPPPPKPPPPIPRRRRSSRPRSPGRPSCRRSCRRRRRRSCGRCRRAARRRAPTRSRKSAKRRRRPRSRRPSRATKPGERRSGFEGAALPARPRPPRRPRRRLGPRRPRARGPTQPARRRPHSRRTQPEGARR